jgi:hypothetical protein
LRAALVTGTCALVAACGNGTSQASSSAKARERSIAAPTATSRPQLAQERQGNVSVSARLLDWPEFGLDPQRTDASAEATGIVAGNIDHLRHVHVKLPGTVDSSPIYLHDVKVAHQTVDAIVVSTTYGRTLALDAATGRILWTFTPPGYSNWAGSAQITTASPLADPSGRYVYAASPNGLVHKLSLASGHEDSRGAWPVRVTLDPSHQKLAAALNIDGAYVITATGGYIGDIPPYQGHVVLIDRASGHIVSVYNTLCANRRRLFAPESCPVSDSAILSRAGAVVEPGGRRILLATGNAPWNGHTDLGDSVLELTLPSLRLRQAYTPPDQEKLNDDDLDLGSSGPALLGGDRAVLAGKDGILRVLNLSRLDGSAPPREGRYEERLGGAAQQLPLPGGGMLFTAPAVWRHGGRTTVFIADEHATAAYALRSGRLALLWQNQTPGTSPVLAGGLLYVYEPVAGGIEVYDPGSPHALTKLPGTPGHWNSPIVVDGHVIEPEGDANEHELSGTLDIFSAP